MNSYRLMKYIRLLISHLILIAFVLFAVFPIYYVLITSFSEVPTLASISISSLIPRPSTLTLSAYYYILFKNPFFLWLRNSLILGVSSMLIATAAAFLGAVALSRINMPGKSALIYMIYVLTFFPFTVTVIPLYLMFAQLHLINTYYGLIIAYSGGSSIFGAYLGKIFIDSIPREFEEAAMIDGLGRFSAFTRILLPMSGPVLAFVALTSFIGAYTDYVLASAFITNGKLWTLTLGMYYLAVTNRTTLYNVFAAFAVLMGLPIFILFMALQKFLLRAYSLGGLKA
ncbi:MAG: sugar ABC transporter permease [Thermocladium sp.]